MPWFGKPLRWMHARSLGMACCLAWLVMPWVLLWGQKPAPRTGALPGISSAGEPTSLSSDGRLLATVKKYSEDPRAVRVTIPYDKPLDFPKTISIWDIDSSQTRFKKTEPNAQSIDFSPDLSHVLVVWYEGEFRLWNTKNSTLLPLQPNDGGFFPGNWSFSPHGDILATDGMYIKRPSNRPGVVTEQGMFKLWSLDDLKVLAEIPNPDPLPQRIGFAPHGCLLALRTGRPLKVHFFDWATKETIGFVRFPIASWKWNYDFLFSPHGGTLAVYQNDVKRIVLIDTASRQVQHIWEMEGFPDAATFSPDGSLLAVNATGMELGSRKLLQSLHSKIADLLAPLEEHTLLLEVSTGRVLARLPASPVLAFRPDGQTLVTYSKDQDALLLWDVPPRPRLPLVIRWLLVALVLGLTVIWWRRRHSIAANNCSTGAILPEF